MNFSERLGFCEAKPIQLNSMDESLRNRLYNITMEFISQSPKINEILKYVVDKIGCLNVSAARETVQIFNTKFLNLDGQSYWYTTYEILEYIMQAKRLFCKCCEYDCHERGHVCEELTWLEVFPKAINQILVEEKSGYRMADDIFVSVIDEVELNSIVSCTQTPLSPVNIHMKKAMKLYADRKNPDYENSIKESISAVEAICCIITGLSGANATLGKALKKLKENGVTIHGAMEQAFSNLYGYTSDAEGIRHGGIDFSNAPEEDAKYMLVSCSSFINYLIEKHIQIGGTYNGQA